MTPFPLRNRWTSNLSGRSRTASPDHHGPAQLHIAIHQYQSQKRAKIFAQYKIPRKLAVPRGVEPPTFGLGNRCSILLSYGTVRRDLAQLSPPRTGAAQARSAPRA